MQFPDPTRPIEAQDPEVLHAMLVWGEARGEPTDGRAAVAYVPLTRSVTAPWSRTVRRTATQPTLSAIILQPWQFSCFNPGDPNRDKLLRPVEHEGLGLWAACWKTAEYARLGQCANPAPGATHYCTRRLWARPALGRRVKWFEHPEVVSGRTVLVAELGSHAFARTR